MELINDVEGAKLVDLVKWKLGKAALGKKGTFLPFVVLAVSHLCIDDSDGSSV